ncbi:MAG: glycosyltransferase family 2 protein [Planctomycetota bacterium]
MSGDARPPVDLSIVIVNFNTTRFLPTLVASIRSQEFRVEGRPGKLEIILIDNASKAEDAAELEQLRSTDLSVVLNSLNVGYGQANNQGFHLGRGRYHLVLNPDVVMLPGCLQSMVGHLEQTLETAMVSPLAYMEPSASVLMPPNQLPTPELFQQQTRAQTDVEVFKRNLAERTRLSYEYWTATAPLPMEMLSGCALLFRRELYADEFPFDPAFPLYYEDTDMFIRLTERGERMVHLFDARILHFWSQSADTHARGAHHRQRLSEQLYYKKHFGDEGLASYEKSLAESLDNREQDRHLEPFDCVEVPATAEPPLFEFEVGAKIPPFFAEFAGNPIFTLAVGLFPDEEGAFTVSQPMWDLLGPGRYYIRAIDRANFKTLRAWSVKKG